MTNEEAIETLKIAKSDIEWNYPLSYQDALDMAIEALKKQTPKKPLNKKLIEDGYKWEYTCPNCHIVQATVEHKYCNDCGQALDWSK